MTVKLTCSKSKPPLGGLLTSGFVNFLKNNSINVSWDAENKVDVSGNGIICETDPDVLRVIANSLKNFSLYGQSPLEKTQVDHWLTYVLGPLSSKKEFNSSLAHLNKILGPITFLVGKQISIADFAVFASLYANQQWNSLIRTKTAPTNVLRWYKFIESQTYVRNILNNLSEEVLGAIMANSGDFPKNEERITTSGRAQEGKFVDLPGAEMGKVVVRFPPEASGYLHIGHAKAALLNQYYQQTFEGKLIMRFDDTNPAKENTHFEEVILEDVAMLEIKPDRFTYTSDYFDLFLEYCEKMLKEGAAYVDDTEPEAMKQEREQKVESTNRNNDVKKNLKMWDEMKRGTEYGQKCCVRAKIDMKSLNGCLRDPTIYRCKNEPHPRTGAKYKVYPTYDFACPIVDSIEGVTHTLRTMEYHDRDPQFYWFIHALGLRKPYIWEYSRLSMTNTVLSKRKLTWFVDEGLVDGWDDPRMPTVRGVLRRGMTVQGLKEFIIAQGSSRSVVFMEWDKIWAFNKKVIDPIAPRYTIVDQDYVAVDVQNTQEECLTVPKHPKNNEIGTKSVWVGQKILIDRADANSLKEGENATFINWGNLMIKKIIKQNGKIVSITAEPNLNNKDYKKTLKVTFLCETKQAAFTPTFCVYFDHLISKPLLGKDEDFKQFVNRDTRKDIQVLGDPELRNLKRGDIIQIQRKGFFRVDIPYGERNIFSCKEQPVILFHIPDGSAKDHLAAFRENQNIPTVKPLEKPTSSPIKAGLKSAETLNNEIVEQGNLVRDLKAKKASKSDIDNAVKSLLALKAEYKQLSGSEWKPSADKKTENKPASTQKSTASLNDEIVKQENLVRDLKSKIDAATKSLLSLKAEYLQLSGSEWKPGSAVSENKSAPIEKSPSKLNDEIVIQGNLVRDLKSKKASKSEIDAAVKTLLALKAEYRQVSGSDWKPPSDNKSEKKPVAPVKSADHLNQEIVKQGNLVRDLKAKKSNKTEIDAAVKVLLSLKAEYAQIAGSDWKPGSITTPVSSSNDEKSLLDKIAAQGDKVRELKSKKAPKTEIDAEVKLLLTLKDDFKNITGKVWSPALVEKRSEINKSEKPGPNETNLLAKTSEQGDKNKKPKSAEKSEIGTVIKKKIETKPEIGNKESKGKKENKPQGGAKTKSESKENKEQTLGDSNVKKQTRLGLEAKKEEDLPNWYSQVITKGQLIEYYNVSGCYIYRPWSFAIWEAIKQWLDAEIKKLKVKNCYFPIFVSKSMLEKEKSHIADFSPEVAWVTKYGESDMSEPIAIRPTSETVMYPTYAKWIESYRELPIKLNQWNNVVRWEFKHPQPFLRTREFLWQEGHTAYATKEEATEEVEIILDLYARIYTDLLAVPVVKGRKTTKEKFAGGDYTYTVEAYISASGRAIQGATSHHLGQNFSKMFDIVFEDPKTNEKKYVYQNSWGMTTRTIGVMVMIHSDNKGLVLPPNIASIQVVIVPCGITVKLSDEGHKQLQAACDSLEADLISAGIKAEGDYRDNYSPGWKFNHWELLGVPIRVELGPKDIEKQQLVAVRRDTGEKITIPLKDAKDSLKKLLECIHQSLLSKATKELNDHIVVFKDWSQFVPNLEKKNLNLVPFCGAEECEDAIKLDSTKDDSVSSEAAGPLSGAKSLCIPLEQPTAITDTDKCIHPSCNRKPIHYTLFGRSY